MVNLCYSEVSETRKFSPEYLPNYGISEREDIYKLVNEIEKIGFLKKTENFSHIFMKFLIAYNKL